MQSLSGQVESESSFNENTKAGVDNFSKTQNKNSHFGQKIADCRVIKFSSGSFPRPDLSLTRYKNY